MAQQNNQSVPKGDDTHSLIMIGAVLLAAVLYQNLGPTVSYIIHEYWYLLPIPILAAGLGIWKIAEWRWKTKNPDKHRRNLTLKFLRTLWGQPGAIFVGATLKDNRGVFLNTEMRSGHVQILGSTGRGKTKSIIVPWFLRDVRNGVAPILIDGKGDSSLIDEIAPVADSAQGKIHSFDITRADKSCSINPLEGGSSHEVADRLFAALEFESSYFREVQYAAALDILEVLDELNETPTLKGLYAALARPEALLDRLTAAKKNSGQPSLGLIKLCQMKAEDREERFSGILSQLRPYSTGVFEKLVNSKSGDENHLNLDTAMQSQLAHDSGISGAIILLPTMQFQKSAKVLGKLILQSLAWSTARRKVEGPMTSVFIDEFSAFVYEGFEQFLNKARSKGVALHLSHQSMGDLEAVSPSFAKTVNVNTNVKVLLGLNDPDTADYFARHLGTFTTTKETERATRGFMGSTNKSGEMSMRAVEEYKIHPNRLKAFSRGQGVLSLLINGQLFTEEVQFDANKSV